MSETGRGGQREKDSNRVESEERNKEGGWRDRKQEERSEGDRKSYKEK